MDKPKNYVLQDYRIMKGNLPKIDMTHAALASNYYSNMADTTCMRLVLSMLINEEYHNLLQKS